MARMGFNPVAFQRQAAEMGTSLAEAVGGAASSSADATATKAKALGHVMSSDLQGEAKRKAVGRLLQPMYNVSTTPRVKRWYGYTHGPTSDHYVTKGRMEEMKRIAEEGGHNFRANLTAR
jgi:hypothetical protein